MKLQLFDVGFLVKTKNRLLSECEVFVHTVLGPNAEVFRSWSTTEANGVKRA